MTDQATRVVPAGWYEDPASSAHVRWWNGLAWTEHVALKPGEPQPQPVAHGYAEGHAGRHGRHSAGGSEHREGADASTDSTTDLAARIAEARELERQYGISTAENDVIMRSVFQDSAAASGGSAVAAESRADEVPASYRSWAAGRIPEETSVPTTSAWLIALWPVLTVVALIAAGYVYFYVSPEPSIAGVPVVAALALVPYVLGIVWAAADARRLRALGYDAPPAALAVLGPLVYLIARRTRVRGSGPLVTLILLTLAIGGGIAAAILTGAAAPATTALEIQQTVRDDLVGSGRLASVNCPVFVESAQPGALYTCQGTLPDGTAKLVWVSIDSRGGDFSYALAVR